MMTSLQARSPLSPQLSRINLISLHQKSILKVYFFHPCSWTGQTPEDDLEVSLTEGGLGILVLYIYPRSLCSFRFTGCSKLLACTQVFIRSHPKARQHSADSPASHIKQHCPSTSFLQISKSFSSPSYPLASDVLTAQAITCALQRPAEWCVHSPVHLPAASPFPMCLFPSCASKPAHIPTALRISLSSAQSQAAVLFLFFFLPPKSFPQNLLGKKKKSTPSLSLLC